MRDLLRFPVKKLWTDYDEEADVLYVSFKRPQKATDSEMRDDGIIIRRRGKEFVGLTILDASTRSWMPAEHNPSPQRQQRLD